VAALTAAAAPQARGRRDGSEIQVAARDVIPGDVVILAEGEVVPADAAFVQSSALLVDESAITGESVPSFGKEPIISD
jgi:Ca2+-transporting ATPase